jgi:release factor glutamine methyltransferase
MIISNPPYILKKNLSKIDNVVKEEPLLALDGGDCGVFIINDVLKHSSKMLKKGGLIFIEIDPSNLPYIKIPNDLECSYQRDQYNKIRFIDGVKL